MNGIFRIYRILLPCILLTFAVLRFPDEYYDVRWPLHFSECDAIPDNGVFRDVESDGKKLYRNTDTVNVSKGDCYARLRDNVLDDLNCDAISPDNEWYVPHIGDKWILEVCKSFVEIWQNIFSLSIRPLPFEITWRNATKAQIAGGNAAIATGKEASNPDSKSAAVDPNTASDEVGPKSPARGSVASVARYLSKGEMKGRKQQSDWQIAEEFENMWTTFMQSILQRTVVMKENPSTEPVKWIPRTNPEPKTENHMERIINPLELLGRKLMNESSELPERNATHPLLPIQYTGGMIAMKRTMDGELIALQKGPDYANTTQDIMGRHLHLLQESVNKVYQAGRSFGHIADTVKARICLLIENLSMGILVNYHIWNLENRDLDSDILISKIFDFNKRNESFIFHDIGPKRWDVLRFLIDKLLVRKKSRKVLGQGTEETGLRMIEIGVDTANSTERLLDSYTPDDLILHVGVDPYGNKPGLGYPNGDIMHTHVAGKLKRFGKRQNLIRARSLEAAATVEDHAFDLVFLDARHDFFSVGEDAVAWSPKLIPQHSILAGHDFQWQYPGLPMAVATIARKLNRPVHLASDGMWWIEFLTDDEYGER